MPLKSGKSDKTISQNISELVKRKSMGYMMFMLKGMTVWAKNKQVCNRMIFSIQVFMMNAKYFWMFTISTLHTFFNQASSFHGFSCITAKTYCKFFSFCFPYTFTRAIFRIMRWRREECLPTKGAHIFFCPLFVHSFIITSTRTILSFSLSGGYILKSISTYFTNSFKSFSCRISSTFRRTKFSSFETVNWDIKFFPTGFTIYNFPCFGFFIHKGGFQCH